MAQAAIKQAELYSAPSHGGPRESKTKYVVEETGPDCFAVLMTNPDAGKQGVCYSGQWIRVCNTDGMNEAKKIAKALNLLETISNLAEPEIKS